MARPSLICCANDGHLIATLATLSERAGYELATRTWQELLAIGRGDFIAGVVLIDLDGAPLRGLVRLERRQASRRSAPFIVVSSRLSLRALQRIRQANPEALFLKPLPHADDLLQAIDAAFDKSSHWQRVLLQSRDRHLVGA